MILLVNFGGGTGHRPRAAARCSVAARRSAGRRGDPGRGWGYATIRYQDIQADRATPGAKA